MPAAQTENRLVGVSGAFDNCFFHAYGLHLLSNNLPLPRDLFTFDSILGDESPASKLQLRFTTANDLSLFADYANSRGQTAPPSNYLVEKTLVLGILMREYFATKMQNERLRSEKTAVDEFTAYLAFRRAGVDQATAREESVLLEANQDFLETLVIQDPAEDVAALRTYWQENGLKNYCHKMATLRNKLGVKDVLPVLTSLGQERLASKIPLNPGQAHYHLIGPEANPMLEEYDLSLKQYLYDRASLLRLKNNAAKKAALKASQCLLLGAILPPRTH